jgi:hypothetical protein
MRIHKHHIEIAAVREEIEWCERMFRSLMDRLEEFLSAGNKRAAGECDEMLNWLQSELDKNRGMMLRLLNDSN